MPVRAPAAGRVLLALWTVAETAIEMEIAQMEIENQIVWPSVLLSPSLPFAVRSQLFALGLLLS